VLQFNLTLAMDVARKKSAASTRRRAVAVDFAGASDLQQTNPADAPC